MNKSTLYKALLRNSQDHNGFVFTHECDSLLFSGLLGCVPNTHVDLEAARDVDNSWHRRPLVYEDCYPSHSKSSISRDMLLGVLYYSVFNSRTDLLVDTLQYAINHKLIMGKAIDLKMLFGRCFMTPGLLGTFAHAAHATGGKKHQLLQLIPLIESKKVTGFQAHLSVLHILMRNALTGKKDNQDILHFHANRQQHNPLFQFAAGHKHLANMLLNREHLWPSDRQPTRQDRSSEWLTQRDFGKDWMPHPTSDDKISTAEYVFLNWLFNEQDLIKP